MSLLGCFGVCHETWSVGSCSAPCQQNGQQDTCKSDDQVLGCFLISEIWLPVLLIRWRMSKSWVFHSSSCKVYALILLVYLFVSCYFLFWALLAMNLNSCPLPPDPLKQYLNNVISGLAWKKQQFC